MVMVSLSLIAVMKVFLSLFSLLAPGILVPCALSAQSTSTSGSYTLLHAPAGSAAGGGQVSAGGTIVAETSIGNAIGGGVSNLTTGGVQLKNNYIGQLYDVTAIEVDAAPTTINEGGTRQLTTTVELDDATFLALEPDAFTWAFGAAIASINPSTGIATAAPVFENTATAVSAAYAGVTSPDLSLVVLDIDPDNYLSYGADGLDDLWQIGFYGVPPNAEAAPGFDKDFDGDNNTKEFLFGTSPLDGNDFFQLTVLGYSAPETVDFVGNIFIPSRTYTLMAATDLETYVPAGSAFSVSATERDYQLQDTGATEDVEFYIMEVERP
jgi:hypothetical protein